MKLLIVDDEELTRTGVISSIDWKALGIDEVLQADDGAAGLDAARIHRPEIILCDVRMPRMDGITMLSHIETFLPDTVSIFMSGYSDKEYLKAAIRLKAISYIEKPLDPSEIREAVAEARSLYLKKEHSHRGEAIHSMETAQRLALSLTVPYSTGNSLSDRLAAELSLPLDASTYITAVIVRIGSDVDLSLHSTDGVYHALQEILLPHGLDCIYVEKHLSYLVYFIFGSSMPDTAARQDIRSFFLSQYASFSKFYIAAGDIVQGIKKAYDSYTCAVILLQNSFFFPTGTFLNPEILEKPDTSPKEMALPQNPTSLFTSLLDARDEAGCQKFTDSLSSYYDRNQKVLPNQARDLYYKLFQALETASRQVPDPEESGSVLDTMDQSFSYQELHGHLMQRLEQFFQDSPDTIQENSTILMIREYISQNYMKETLSVRDISEHVFLSTSYVCTFFKNETGQTLNQYLTGYRMERAKQLLADPRYKIADISSRVGYSDGNYFGKSFKKFTGLSPSEYRDKLT